MKLLGNNFLVLNCIVRVNQMEARRDLSLMTDESEENTVENAVKFRNAVTKGFPGGAMTWALSWGALHDQRENYKQIRAKIKKYHEMYGDEVTFIPGGYAGSIYNTRKMLNDDIREGLQAVRSFMGENYKPKALIAGFLSAANQKYLSDCENIKVCQGNQFSQLAVDLNDGEGLICYPYYPSVEHALKPAQGKSDFVDCVNLDGWSMDLLSARYAGMQQGNINSRMGFGPLETHGVYGLEKGTEIMLSVMEQYFGEGFKNNGFGYAATNWELCLVHPGGHHNNGVYEEGVEDVLSKAKRKFAGLKMVTAGTFGELFRDEYPDNGRLNYRFHHKGTGVGGSEADKEIFWYMNKKFRLAILRENENPQTDKVIDFTDYTVKVQEPADPDIKNNIYHRNWSLFGEINQKGLRPQDTPVPIVKLSEKAKKLIAEYYPQLFSKP